MNTNAYMREYMSTYRAGVRAGVHTPNTEQSLRERARVRKAARERRRGQTRQVDAHEPLYLGHCPFCGLQTDRAPDCCVVCQSEIEAGRM